MNSVSHSVNNVKMSTQCLYNKRIQINKHLSFSEIKICHNSAENSTVLEKQFFSIFTVPLFKLKINSQIYTIHGSICCFKSTCSLNCLYLATFNSKELADSDKFYFLEKLHWFLLHYFQASLSFLKSSTDQLSRNAVDYTCGKIKWLKIRFRFRFYHNYLSTPVIEMKPKSFSKMCLSLCDFAFARKISRKYLIGEIERQTFQGQSIGYFLNSVIHSWIKVYLVHI